MHAAFRHDNQEDATGRGGHQEEGGLERNKNKNTITLDVRDEENLSRKNCVRVAIFSGLFARSFFVSCSVRHGHGAGGGGENVYVCERFLVTMTEGDLANLHKRGIYIQEYTRCAPMLCAIQ